MSRERVLGTYVTDWDDMVTDGEAQEAQYWDLYCQEASRNIGVSETNFRDEMDSARQEVLAHPDMYGWKSKGIIVAPATLVLPRVCADLVGIRLEKPFSDDDLQRIFEVVSPQLTPVFKPDAGDYLRELNTYTNLIVATNSSTKKVRMQAQMLLGDNSLKISGDKKKYIPDENQIPIFVEGLSRPVYQERPIYGKFLDSLEGPVRVGGDSWELDLGPAEQRGMTTYLVPAPGKTPDYEKKRYEDHPNGQLVSSLEELKEIILQQT